MCLPKRKHLFESVFICAGCCFKPGLSKRVKSDLIFAANFVFPSCKICFDLYIAALAYKTGFQQSGFKRFEVCVAAAAIVDFFDNYRLFLTEIRQRSARLPEVIQIEITEFVNEHDDAVLKRIGIQTTGYNIAINIGGHEYAVGGNRPQTFFVFLN